jgi:hypothetical protein
MFKIKQHTNFHTPNSNGSLVITAILQDKYRFHMTTICFTLYNSILTFANVCDIYYHINFGALHQVTPEKCSGLQWHDVHTIFINRFKIALGDMEK